jgi:hypothetical protein
MLRHVEFISTRTFGLTASRQPGIHFSTTRWLSSNSTTSIDESSQSARSRFRNTEANPSVLKYIERIGVGKPSRMKRRRRPNDAARHLSLAEEEDQLGRRRRPKTTAPPPPFASSNRNITTESGQSIRQLPVKLLARVGSLDTPFPKSSPNLPEVVSGCSWCGPVEC